jgi:protein-S-isoprenylcysteine O-methyltransferase Ste14
VFCPSRGWRAWEGLADGGGGREDQSHHRWAVSRIRHPIYALSIAHVICTASWFPAADAGGCFAHIGLANVKARNEERYLLATQGESYALYVQRTGRFFPRRS